MGEKYKKKQPKDVLYELKGELIKQGRDPEDAIAAVLGCTKGSAKNRLDNIVQFKASEASKIHDAFFADMPYNRHMYFRESAEE